MTFDSFGHNASKILFALGWILGILMFLLTFFPVLFQGNGDIVVAGLAGGIVAAINAVMAPWIAAAVLWRVDRFLETRA